MNAQIFSAEVREREKKEVSSCKQVGVIQVHESHPQKAGCHPTGYRDLLSGLCRGLSSCLSCLVINNQKSLAFATTGGKGKTYN